MLPTQAVALANNRLLMHLEISENRYVDHLQTTLYTTYNDMQHPNATSVRRSSYTSRY